MEYGSDVTIDSVKFSDSVRRLLSKETGVTAVYTIAVQLKLKKGFVTQGNACCLVVEREGLRTRYSDNVAVPREAGPVSVIRKVRKLLGSKGERIFEPNIYNREGKENDNNLCGFISVNFILSQLLSIKMN